MLVGANQGEINDYQFLLTVLLLPGFALTSVASSAQTVLIPDSQLALDGYSERILGAGLGTDDVRGGLLLSVVLPESRLSVLVWLSYMSR